MINTPLTTMPVAEGRADPISRRFLEWIQQTLLRSIPERLHPTPEVITAEYDAKPWDLVRADPTGGAFTVNLPRRCIDGDEFAYVNEGASANPVTFAPATGDTVAGGASITNATPGGSERLVFAVKTRNWIRL
jgi:hypothetical protein